MEMQTSTMPSGVTRPTVKDAVASQVLEIIGGITLEALQTLEEPESGDVWSGEEGDDSVFFSEESQDQQDDMRANTSGDFGAGKCERHVNRETADEGKDDPGEAATDVDGVKMEATRHVFPTERGEECRELLTPMNNDGQSDAADPGAQSTRCPDKPSSSCGESLHLNCTKPDVQIQSEQIMSAEKASLLAEEDEAFIDMQAQELQLHNIPNEENPNRLNVEAEPSAKLQVSGDRRLEVGREPEKDHNIQVPVGFHQKSRPAHSTLPLPNKHSHQKSFDHLSSSKYSTMSYRKIRRGNTRQKIEKFEYMMMKL